MVQYDMRNTLVRLGLVLPVLATPYEEYILAPSSRTLAPVSVHETHGQVSNPAGATLKGYGKVVFEGPSAVTYDFGINIAGIVSVEVASSSSNAAIGLTYSESSLWVNTTASDATADEGLDEIIWLPIGEGPGTYTVDKDHERGGFRYLTIVSNSSDSVEMEKVTTYFTASPDMNNMRAYTGYFHSDDELLNRIWYAGAYTNQLCTIDPAHGDALVHFGETITTDTVTWYNNASIANGTSCIADGGKRDRLVWPGDLAVSVPTISVSTYDTSSIKASISSLMALQNSEGIFPYAGNPIAQILPATSFTYHLYSIVSLSDYAMYSGDVTFMKANWDRFVRGLTWSLTNIDETGLMNVTSSLDWGRIGMGGYNIEANAVLFHALHLGIQWSEYLNNTTMVATWNQTAIKLKTAANQLLWNPNAGLYNDNETTTLTPQDGNSWAVKAGLPETIKQAQNISRSLQARWGPYGAPAPEAGSAISPFISGREAEAHLVATNTKTALDLFRLEWGFMLDDPRMTGSSFIEGYSSNGDLSYFGYTNDARINHAHAWGSAPTSLLSTHVAGIKILSAAGKTWEIAPQMGDLKNIDAGFSTVLGQFSVQLEGDGEGNIAHLSFCTPIGTIGTLSVLKSGTLRGRNGQTRQTFNGSLSGLAGGCWTLV